MSKQPLLIVLSLASAFIAIAFLLYARQPVAKADQLLASAAPSWGADVQVNPNPSATPAVQINPILAVDPLNPNLVLAGYDSDEASGTGTGYASSTDGGRSWVGGRFTGPWGAQNLIPDGNVNVAFDGQGVGYYSTHVTSADMVGYVVLTTTDGMSWSAPLPVVISSNSELRSQANLEVDARSTGAYAGSLYMSWFYSDNVAPFNHGIQMRYSRDGGRTWSADIQVSDSGNEYSNNPLPVVAPNGDVYIAFEELDNGSITNQPRLYLDKSTDGGTTWNTDQVISGAPIVSVGRPDPEGHEFTLVGSANCTQGTLNLLHVDHFPSIAISPDNSNTVYAVWNDSRWDATLNTCGDQVPVHHSDIAFSRSTDAGATWTQPLRLNDDLMGNGLDQFQPIIQVAPNGEVGASWFDRRYGIGGYQYNVEYSGSTDGGITWSANQRISDRSSNPDANPDQESVDDIGFRTGLVFGPDYVLAAWPDSRNWDGSPADRRLDIFADRQALAGPIPSVTPTQLTTETPTQVVTATGTPTVCTISFEDVPTGNTFYSYVECLACRGIMSGYECGGAGEPCNSANDPYFRPDNNITRGQLSKIVSNSANFNDTPTGQSFEDVSPGSTFYIYIERMTSRGIMGGYSCGGAGEPCNPPANRPYFRPNANATRGQISKIISNAANFAETHVGQTFQDVAPDSPFYIYIERLASRGVMGGYSCGVLPQEPCVAPGNLPYFRPGNTATRGQVAKIDANTFYPSCATTGLPRQVQKTQ